MTMSKSNLGYVHFRLLYFSVFSFLFVPIEKMNTQDSVSPLYKRLEGRGFGNVVNIGQSFVFYVFDSERHVRTLIISYTTLYFYSMV